MSLNKESIIDVINLIIENINLSDDGKPILTYKEIYNITGISQRSIRRIKKSIIETGNYKGIIGTNFLIAGTLQEPHTKRGKFDNKTFIITSAQSNTMIHDKLWKTINTFAKHNNAQIIVGTFKYNKSLFSGKQENLWFDKRLHDFICDKPMQLSKGLVYCGEFNISPTAVTPLSGLYNYTGEESGIFPHAKMQVESIPTPKFDTPKMLYTTGCVTQMNYIQQKAGTKAEWHHIFGALVVEICEDGTWFVRQLQANSESGEFYDLETLYTPNLVILNQSVEAINYGDIHSAGLNQEVANISWRKGTIKNQLKESILDVLRPKYQFMHDVLDQHARNHHNIKDPHFLFRMFSQKTESVQDEISHTIDIIKETLRPWCKTIIVESNHNLALTQWLKEQDYRKDPVNAIFFLEMQLAIYRAISKGEDLQVFKYACDKITNDLNEVLFLKEDESFRICKNIECGSHGHNGNNGSRGGIQTYLKLGIKHNLGHVHGAAMREGVVYAGMSGNLDQGYNKGGSGWNHSHIITYTNGKRTIITLKNGKWRR